MNRRTFLSAFAALPLVGRLIGPRASEPEPWKYRPDHARGGFVLACGCAECQAVRDHTRALAEKVDREIRGGDTFRYRRWTGTTSKTRCGLVDLCTMRVQGSRDGRTWEDL